MSHLLIPLPTTMPVLMTQVIQPALSDMQSRLSSPAAAVILGTISGQETNLAARTQYNNGPAHGLWQFERIGVQGVIESRVSGFILRDVCLDSGIIFSVDAIHEALLHDDLFACKVARLNMWDDSSPLPDLGDKDGGWALYKRVWRPGRNVDKSRWDHWYPLALAAVNSLTADYWPK